MNFILKLVGCIGVAIFINGCASLKSSLSLGKTYSEELVGYTYIPVEPLEITIRCPECQNSSSLTLDKKMMLASLPDNSTRLATRRISGGAEGGGVGANFGVAGNTYEVIMDYVNTQTINVKFYGYWQGFETDFSGKITKRKTTGKSVRFYSEFPIDTKGKTDTDGTIWRLEVFGRDGLEPSQLTNSLKIVRSKFCDSYKTREYNKITNTNLIESELLTSNGFNVPVYVGTGLRLRAKISVTSGQVNFSSLGSIAAAVSANKAIGTMSVQTIGITGAMPRTTLQLVNEINDSTISSSIQVLSGIKAAVEGEKTTISPRIVGFHNTIGADAQGISLIHSLLAEEPIEMIVVPSLSFGGSTGQ